MKKQYAIWLGGVAVLCGGAFAVACTKILPVQSGLIMMGVYWLWTGLLCILNQHPEFRNKDRWEKQVWGLTLFVMGVLWTVMSFTQYARHWLPMVLSLIPPGAILAIGLGWYVDKKRNEEYHKNQTEKD